MCGIVCAFRLKESSEFLRPKVLSMAKCIRHRGPDWSGIFSNEKALMAHERLAIVDPTSGKQPLFSEDKKLVLAANGEIYNHTELRTQFEGRYNFQTNSDCEVILALYQEKGNAFLDELNGIFGFAIYNVETDAYLIARDHMGIIPLYIGWDENGTFYVASELKALEGVCTKIELFPPGHYLDSNEGELKRWYTRDWMEYDAVKENETDILKLRKALEDAVHRQLMSDVPYGVLLSGGLDSSITSAIAKKYANKRIESNDQDKARYAIYRDQVNTDSEAFIKLIEKEQLILDVKQMHYVARWITPEGPPRRFDARFFISRMPSFQTPVHDNSELVHSAWFSPKEILEKFDQGEMVLMSPTLRMVRNLAKFTSADEAIKAAAQNMPSERARINHKRDIILPGDEGYDQGEENVEFGWVSLRPS